MIRQIWIIKIDEITNGPSRYTGCVEDFILFAKMKIQLKRGMYQWEANLHFKGISFFSHPVLEIFVIITDVLCVVPSRKSFPV